MGLLTSVAASFSDKMPKKGAKAEKSKASKKKNRKSKKRQKRMDYIEKMRLQPVVEGALVDTLKEAIDNDNEPFIGVDTENNAIYFLGLDNDIIEGSSLANHLGDINAAVNLADKGDTAGGIYNASFDSDLDPMPDESSTDDAYERKQAVFLPTVNTLETLSEIVDPHQYPFLVVMNPADLDHTNIAKYHNDGLLNGRCADDEDENSNLMMTITDFKDFVQSQIAPPEAEDEDTSDNQSEDVSDSDMSNSETNDIVEEPVEESETIQADESQSESPSDNSFNDTTESDSSIDLDNTDDQGTGDFGLGNGLDDTSDETSYNLDSDSDEDLANSDPYATNASANTSASANDSGTPEESNDLSLPLSDSTESSLPDTNSKEDENTMSEDLNTLNTVDDNDDLESFNNFNMASEASDSTSDSINQDSTNQENDEMSTSLDDIVNESENDETPLTLNEDNNTDLDSISTDSSNELSDDTTDLEDLDSESLNDDSSLNSPNDDSLDNLDSLDEDNLNEIGNDDLEDLDNDSLDSLDSDEDNLDSDSLEDLDSISPASSATNNFASYLNDSQASDSNPFALLSEVHPISLDSYVREIVPKINDSEECYITKDESTNVVYLLALTYQDLEALNSNDLATLNSKLKLGNESGDVKDSVINSSIRSDLIRDDNNKQLVILPTLNTVETLSNVLPNTSYKVVSVPSDISVSNSYSYDKQGLINADVSDGSNAKYITLSEFENFVKPEQVQKPIVLPAEDVSEHKDENEVSVTNTESINKVEESPGMSQETTSNNEIVIDTDDPDTLSSVLHNNDLSTFGKENDEAVAQILNKYEGRINSLLDGIKIPKFAIDATKDFDPELVASKKIYNDALQGKAKQIKSNIKTQITNEIISSLRTYVDPECFPERFPETDAELKKKFVNETAIQAATVARMNKIRDHYNALRQSMIDEAIEKAKTDFKDNELPKRDLELSQAETSIRKDHERVYTTAVNKVLSTNRKDFAATIDNDIDKIITNASKDISQGNREIMTDTNTYLQKLVETKKINELVNRKMNMQPIQADTTSVSLQDYMKKYNELQNKFNGAQMASQLSVQEKDDRIRDLMSQLEVLQKEANMHKSELEETKKENSQIRAQYEQSEASRLSAEQERDKYKDLSTSLKTNVSDIQPASQIVVPEVKEKEPIKEDSGIVKTIIDMPKAKPDDEITPSPN